MAASASNSTSNSNFTSFTITQPFLGAPLQFQPALGSQELDTLIDAFVTGSASKQDKLSQVTIDFFNHATVDIMTGALVRRYEVVLPCASEQSGYDSQSSAFSPQMFTPSPSSSTAFGESMRGSVSTSPARVRVSKKPRKEARKTAEAKIPGFQIMTKDGVDVTSSLGRGTKTKEQREHAHLMRIMKACDACKKKKTRCDPSHRRSHNDMSRTSTKTSTSSQSNQSPAVSTPSLSLSRETTNASSQSLSSFGANAMNDFVLFPEDTPSWNAADLSMSGFDQNLDLSDFNFDIAGGDNFDLDQSFDFSAFEQSGLQQPSYSQNNTGHFDPLHWDNSNFLQSSAVGNSQPVQTSCSPATANWFADSNSSFELSDSPSSALTPSSSQMDSMPQTPAFQDRSVTDQQSTAFSSMDWDAAAAPRLGGSELAMLLHGDRTGPDRSREGSGGLVRRSDAAIRKLISSVPSYSSEASAFVEPSDQWLHNASGVGLSHNEGLQGQSMDPGSVQSLDKVRRGLNRLLTVTNASLNRINSSQDEYAALASELLQLRDALDDAKAGDMHRIRSAPLNSAANVLQTQLQGLLTVVEPNTARDVNSALVRQCVVNTRRLIQALRATTNAQANRRGSVVNEHSITSRASGITLSSSGNYRLESAVPQDEGIMSMDDAMVDIARDHSSSGNGRSVRADTATDAYANGTITINSAVKACSKEEIEPAVERASNTTSFPLAQESMHSPSHASYGGNMSSKDNWPLGLNPQTGGLTIEDDTQAISPAVTQIQTSRARTLSRSPTNHRIPTGSTQLSTSDRSTNTLLGFSEEYAWGATQTTLVRQTPQYDLDTAGDIIDNASSHHETGLTMSPLHTIAIMTLCALAFATMTLNSTSLNASKVFTVSMINGVITVPSDIMPRILSCVLIMIIATLGKPIVLPGSIDSSQTFKSTPMSMFSKAITSVRSKITAAKTTLSMFSSMSQIRSMTQVT